MDMCSTSGLDNDIKCELGKVFGNTMYKEESLLECVVLRRTSGEHLTLQTVSYGSEHRDSSLYMALPQTYPSSVPPPCITSLHTYMYSLVFDYDVN